MEAIATVSSIWNLLGLAPDALQRLDLTGRDPVLPSSFHVGAAAQASIAAAALAACEVGRLRGQAPARVAVSMLHAALQCKEWFSIDGVVPPQWDPFSGLYETSDGHVRIHANFRHHRDGALRLLGLEPERATRADVEAAMRRWRAIDFESAAADARMVATAARTFEQWDVTPAAHALRSLPLLSIERIEGGPEAGPLPWPALAPSTPTTAPLAGLRVLDLTRILAGPVGGRALAAHGADVMLVNSPNLPNIDAVASTSRGKLSTHVDLRSTEGRRAFDGLLEGAHVMVQGYRPGGLESLGYGPQDAAGRRPGIVYVSLSAYGHRGPWSGRRGFDSLLQTALGFNLAEGAAAGDGKPRPLPMQILDEATGYLIAAAAAAGLHRQQREGGSWHVRVSLAQTALWLRGLGRVENGFSAATPALEAYVDEEDSGFGRLALVSHSALVDGQPVRWPRPSMPPGSHRPEWP